MTAENPNLREELNNGSGPFRLADVDRQISWGDLLGAFIQRLENTETGIDPSAGTPTNTLQLATAPNSLLDARATAGAGALNAALTLIVDNRDATVPNAGEIVWDGPGATRVRFNAADAFTAVDVKYVTDGVDVSILERSLSQNDLL